MADNKKNPTTTIPFDEESPRAMKAFEYLKSLKRKQGKFVTALILWFLDNKENLRFDEVNGVIIDKNAVIKMLKESGVDDGYIERISESPELLSSLATCKLPEFLPELAKVLVMLGPAKANETDEPKINDYRKQNTSAITESLSSTLNEGTRGDEEDEDEAWIGGMVYADGEGVSN